MEVRKNQVLGGSRLDSQGEKLSFSFLKNYCNQCKGKRIPLHQHHDMVNKTVGYIENIRLEKNETDDEWLVVGDVYSEIGAIDELIGGFSISGFDSIYEPPKSEFLVCIPYPAYNNIEFIKNLRENEKLHIGKWVKKLPVRLD